MKYIIDACALIAYLRDEDGAERFKELLYNKKKQLCMHAINLGEVYYDSLRISNIKKANEVLSFSFFFIIISYLISDEYIFPALTI